MWIRLPSSSLRLTGADRVDFVQGQMTGDLRGAPTPGMVAGAFLNVRGQIEQFARVYRREHDVYLHLDEGQAPALAARLKRYVIFDQVEIQDSTALLATVHVQEAEQLAGWNSSGPDAQQFELAGITALGGRVNRTGTPGVDLHYLRRHEDALLAALPGAEGTLADLNVARIRAGIPDIVRDGFSGTLLQEIGMDVGGPLPAISYRKGCYVGQEIMARLEARGNARYHLAQLVGEHLPEHAEVTQGGRVVGQSGQHAASLSLARLRRELENGAPVEVGGIPASVRLLNATHA
ncbi:folate-binding protein YgfZ [Deinococcus sp. KSM4-11]|uniref:CAF17-like 4Fe-4S cluster assembly/insertion protein YgfZ n=1 Tax=Deinococcus sp. KSM4-11 TaxID=2568654 RepID=UPI0010A4ED06|nr:folate-binding protein YgfZ [Deinococcus sp. KSM4-11]THF83930.1 folate-binding protein YgfZ [Deinococcus sp. KSM4-11]